MVLVGLQVLLGILFVLGAGVPKLYGEAFQVQLFADIGAGQWLRYAVGVLEVAGGLALLVPRLAGAAAAGLTVVMLGATLTWPVLMGQPEMSLVPAVILLLVAVVAVARRNEMVALVRTLGRSGG